MPSPLSRRAWLRTTSLGVGAGLLLPNGLAAAEPIRDTEAGPDDLASYARTVEQARQRAGAVRLKSNENPYGMSPRAKQAMLDAWDEHNKYQSPGIPALQQAFADHVGVPMDHVMVTQGSQEVLCTAVLAFASGREVLAADPTFEALPRYATHMGLRVHRVPLTDDLVHDLDAMDQRYSSSIGLVFVCNPNNPTATLAAKARDYVSSTAGSTMVLVDEAYHDYVTDPGYSSMIDLVMKGENVIVLRTASKIHGFAGCRIGFAVARPDVIEQMRGCVTGPPNALAARAATVALGDTAWQEMCRARNTEGREILRNALTALGRRQSPSNTNFIFFHAGRPVTDVQAAAEAEGFLVGRPFPPYTDWVRVSVGTPDEMRSFVSVLPRILRV